LRALPLQFRELPSVPGKNVVEETAGGGGEVAAAPQEMLGHLLNLAAALTEIAGWRRRLRASAQKGWPAAQTSTLLARLRTDGSDRFVLIANYSFHVAGQRYGGQFKAVFTTEPKAQERLQHLLNSRPLVRYKRSHPDTSILDVG
jgi:hypothetical protein